MTDLSDGEFGQEGSAGVCRAELNIDQINLLTRELGSDLSLQGTIVAFDRVQLLLRVR